MAAAVSATKLEVLRPGFGQALRPAPGSVLAALPDAAADEAPDYAFHWFRDAAAVMDAAVTLAAAGVGRRAWLRRLAEWIAFENALGSLDGAAFLPRHRDLRRATAAGLRRYVRPDAEVAAVTGPSAPGEARCNPDGSIDSILWSRPQHDGPALAALTCLRLAVLGFEPAGLRDLLLCRLDYTAGRAGEPCVGIWEEESGLHYHTLLLQHAALARGAAWARRTGERGRGARYASRAAALRAPLDGLWSPEAGFYRGRAEAEPAAEPKALDASVLVAVLQARLPRGRHSLGDPRVQATARRLARHFSQAFAINRGCGEAPLLGRYPGDRYAGGGAWFVTGLALAEFLYRRAARAAGGAHPMARADLVLARARRQMPGDGRLPEQMDRDTGAPRSAADLAWSHAALIGVWHARRAASDALKASRALV